MKISNGVNNQKLNNILKDPDTNWKYIAIVAIVGLVVLTGILAYQNFWPDDQEISLTETLETPEQSEAPTDWKIYTNEEYGFEVSYPENIFQLDKNRAMLLHTLRGFHKYSQKDGSDGGLAKDISITFEKDITRCDEAEQWFPSLAESFEFKNANGLKYLTGAEGEGVVYYCIKNKAGETIFLVERSFLSEAYSLDLSDQKDYITSQAQLMLFNQILSTFKFLE